MTTLFQHSVFSPWLLAVSHGHSAMTMLKVAKDIQLHCEGLRSGFPDKKQEEMSSSELAIFASLSTEIINDGKSYLKAASASVMLYQAMMEAIINNEIETHNKLSTLTDNQKNTFKKKWENALIEVGANTTEFLRYHSDIYKKYRNPLVHPSRTKSDQFDDMEWQVLLDGYFSGWKAYEQLYMGLGNSHDPDVWNTMLKVNGLIDH